jgi:hypothetical protein
MVPPSLPPSLSLSPSDNRVLDRIGKGVAKMQAPRHIWWRQTDHEPSFWVGLRNTATLKNNKQKVDMSRNMPPILIP